MKIESEGITMPGQYVKLCIATNSHLGGRDVSEKMKRYVYGQRNEGIHVFDLRSYWDKMVLAARFITAQIQTKQQILAVTSKPVGAKPVTKFAEAIKCNHSTGRFVPGTLTNIRMRGSVEPKIIVVSDPITDYQAIQEASGIGVFVIAFSNSSVEPKFVDVCIPSNTRSAKAVGTSFFILSRLVQYMITGESLDRDMSEVELFFQRHAVELEAIKQELEDDKAQQVDINAFMDSKLDRNASVSQFSNWVETQNESEWSQVDSERKW